MTTTDTLISDLVGALRSSWTTSAQALTGTADLGAWLAQRIDGLAAADRLDKGALLAVLDEVATALQEAGRVDIDVELNRRLLRSVYEFLLAVDARTQRVAAGLPAIEDEDEAATHHGRPVVVLAGTAAGAHPGPAPAAPPSKPDPGTFPVRRGEGHADTARRAAEVPAPAVAAASLSTECDRLLRADRFGEVAALLTRLVAEGRVDGVKAIALAAGDHCRGAAAVRAASDCYLAAWNADRLDEVPLWRLAELALTSQDIELTVSYLDRLAAVLQWRGDLRGAARVFRKMTILAPEREDLKEMLRRAQSAAGGRTQP